MSVSSPPTRVAIVTGAASGIGRATVENFAASGVSVVAVDRDREHLGWIDGAGLSECVEQLVGDVTSDALNAQAVHLACTRFGRLDAAVFNAGVSMGGGLLELPMEEFDRAVSVNVRAVAIGIRSVVPALRESGGGRIVVTASTSGIGGDPNLWAYNTAKGAVINLVRAAAVDLGADGITVNAVCPGPTETTMTSRLQQLPEAYESLRRSIPAQRWGRPEEIASVIAFLASPRSAYITGQNLEVAGGYMLGLKDDRESSS